MKKKELNILLAIAVVAVIALVAYWVWKKPSNCTSGSPCPPPTPIYKYYGGKILPGYDVQYLPNLKGNVPALEDACNKDEMCLSFSTDGHLKSNADAANLVPCGDMYFKVDIPPIPVVVPIPPKWATSKNSLDTQINSVMYGNNYIVSPSGTTDKTGLVMNITGDLELTQNGQLVQNTNTGNSAFQGGFVTLKSDGALYVINNSATGGNNVFKASPSFALSRYVLWVENGQIMLMDDNGVTRNIQLNKYS